VSRPLFLGSTFAWRANLAAALAAACFAGTAHAAVEDTFPREATREAILRWLAGNSDLSPDSVVTMTDELVVAITEREDGRGVGRSTRLTLREEVINPDAAAAWGGRSIALDLDLDCSRHRVILGARRIYARPNLQGSVRITRSGNEWAEVPADTVIDDVAHAACAPATKLAAAPPTAPSQTATVPAEPAPAAQPVEAEAAPAPVQVAAADPAPAPPASDTAAVAAQPAQPVEVAAAEPPPAPAPAPSPPQPAPELQTAAPDGPLVVHNPFADGSPAAQAPAPRPAAPAPKAASAAVGPARPAEFAVQIAAAASADLARDSWQSLKARLPGLIGPKTFAVEPVSAKGRTLYRALLLGFDSSGEAEALCKTLRSQSIDCILRQMK
jgi:hypothetical protein